MDSLYAAFLDLRGRRVLVVGGGPVAARKAQQVGAAGARITLVAPHICREAEQAVREADGEVLRRQYESEDVRGRWLVFAATDDPAVNRAVSEDARRAGIFCNVADEAELCTFQAPAAFRRGLLQIAVSTGGACPVLAARIRRRLESTYGEGYDAVMEGLTDLRRHYKAKYPGDRRRREEMINAFLDATGLAIGMGRVDIEAFQRAVLEWKSR